MGGLRGLCLSWWAGVGALALVALVIGLVIPRLGGPAAPAVKPVATGVPQAGVLMPSSGRSVPTLVAKVPVYYAGRTNGLLYREFRDLPARGNIAETALTALLNVAPLDPDFTSWWASASGARVDQVDDTIIVTLPAAAFARAETPEQGRIAIDQLVYTVTAAVGDTSAVKRVRILMDGEPTLPPNFLPSESWKRDGLRPLASLWITSPANAASVPKGIIDVAMQTKPGVGPVTVTITNTAADTRIGRWTADRQGTLAGWQLWRVAADLAPGSYDIRATTPDGASENVVIKVRG